MLNRVLAAVLQVIGGLGVVIPPYLVDWRAGLMVTGACLLLLGIAIEPKRAI